MKKRVVRVPQSQSTQLWTKRAHTCTTHVYATAASGGRSRREADLREACRVASQTACRSSGRGCVNGWSCVMRRQDWEAKLLSADLNCSAPSPADRLARAGELISAAGVRRDASDHVCLLPLPALVFAPRLARGAASPDDPFKLRPLQGGQNGGGTGRGWSVACEKWPRSACVVQCRPGKSRARSRDGIARTSQAERESVCCPALPSQETQHQAC